MYAIFRAGGVQRRASVGDRLRLDRMPQEAGTEVSFPEVLMLGGESVAIGAPTVKGASVTAKVVAHGHGKKVLSFKYQQRNNGRVKHGFRWHYTEVEVTGIQAG